jgi:hypothetical protein
MLEARAQEFNKFLIGHLAFHLDQTAGVFAAKIAQPVMRMVRIPIQA